MLRNTTISLFLTICWIPAAFGQAQATGDRTFPPTQSSKDVTKTNEPGSELAPSVEPESKFSTVIDEALRKAKKERKYVLIALFDRDCEECDRYERTTFVDPEVVEWLEQRVLLIKLDRSDSTGKNFAEAHVVGDAPTLIFMSNDGRELGRQFGYLSPMAFLVKADRIIRNSPSIQDGLTNSWIGEDQVLSTIELAGQLTAEGKYGKALQQYMWCVEHRATRAPIFQVRHLKDLAEGFAGLAAVYEPARTELTRWVGNAKHQTLRKNPQDTYSLCVIKHANRAMNQDDDSVAHFDRMKNRWGAVAGVDAFATLLYEPFLNARRYEDLARFVDQPEHVDEYLDQAQRLRYDAGEIRRNLTERYEILLGLGRPREAKEVVVKLERYDGSAEAYLMLAKAGLRSGKPNDENIAQARQAVELTRLQNAEAVIVFAKLLTAKRPKYPEAINSLRAALALEHAKEDRAALQACLNDALEGKQPPDVHWYFRLAEPE